MPNLAPAMARHLLSHVLRPWRADAFANLEIGSTYAESKALEHFMGILEPKRSAITCPPNDCHKHVDTWCNGPRCAKVAFVQPHSLWTDRSLKLMHCGAPVNSRHVTFEQMTRKRDACYTGILEYERVASNFKKPYKYIVYTRPDLWWSAARALEEFRVLDATGGIYVNGGSCNENMKPRPFVLRTSQQCARSTNVTHRVELEHETGTIQCQAPSDMFAVVPRQWAAAYFSANTMTELLAHPDHRKYPCNRTMAASCGLCQCWLPTATTPGLGMTPECLLGWWLVHNGVPWSSDPAARNTAPAHALASDGQGALISVKYIGMKGQRTLPSHCESYNGTIDLASMLRSVGIQHYTSGGAKAREELKHIYRNDAKMTSMMWCNTSSDLW